MSTVAMTLEIPPIVLRYREAKAADRERRKEQERLEALQREIRDAEDYFSDLSDLCIERPDPAAQMNHAVAWLKSELADGNWKSSKQLAAKAAHDLDCSRQTIQRASQRLNVQKRQTSRGDYEWRMEPNLSEF